MASTAEQVKERLPIVDVLGSYIKIEKAGINYKARCPFHNEKTPSFFISPARNSYYCFGCGEKGDVFSFVERFEGVDFMGALKILADRAGVEISFEKSENKDEKDKIYSLMEDATVFFEENLVGNKKANEYLAQRGLTKETVTSFRIGYVNPEWRSLKDRLNSKGYTDEEISKAGLIKETSGKVYDRFRGRIMFPIMDSAGRVVAFSGRIFEEIPGSTESAKYLNSPETPLFHKSRILYGFDRAKDGMRKLGFAILVEGQMDLILCHQTGFRNAVALSGTALTVEQVSMIERFTNKLLLSLDADVAGVSASGKSAAIALSRGFDVKVAKLSGGKDPADIIKDSPESFREIVRNALHVIDFYLETLREANGEDRKFRLAVEKTVLPFVKLIPSAIDRAHFIERISKAISVPVSAVTEELGKIPEREVGAEDGDIKPSSINIPEAVFSRKDSIVKKLFGVFSLKWSHDKVDVIKEKVRGILGEEEYDKLSNNEEFINEVAFKEENSVSSKEATIEEVEDLVYNLEVEVLREKQKMLKDKIDAGDKSKESLLLYQKVSMELSQKLDMVKSGLHK